MEGHQQVDLTIPPTWAGLNDILFFTPLVPFCLNQPILFQWNLC